MDNGSVEEIQKTKEELDAKFEGGLPKYLRDYFDDAELSRKNRDSYQDTLQEIKNASFEERRTYTEERKENFWKNNKTILIKKKKRLGSHLKPVYQEEVRNEEKAVEERELTSEELRVLVKQCENDLYLFAIRYFSHYLKKPSSEFHKFTYNTLEREINKKRDRGFKWAIAAPRGNAKTSLISSIFPLWCLCYKKKQFIILISNTADLAEDILTDIKAELESNVSLQRDFPQVCGKGSRWRADEIITKHKVKVKALGTGSRVRGRRFGIYRPDLILIDDLEDKDMLRSPTTMRFLRFEWFNKDIGFAGGEKGTATDIVVLGTILGKDSLLNSLLDPSEYPDWKSRRFKAVKRFSDSTLWDDWTKIYRNRLDLDRVDTAKKFFNDHEAEMLEGTEVLWPEGDPYYDLMVEFIKDRGAFECFDKNTDIILSNNKYKKISDIKVGAKILSGDGTTQFVIDTGISSLSNRKVYDIKIAGCKDKLRVTEDHPFLIYPTIKYGNVKLTHQHIGRIKTGTGRYSKEADKRILENTLVWKCAGNLNISDSVILPLRKKNKSCSTHDPEWYWLLGLILAEGSIGCKNSAVFVTMAKHERHYLEKAKKICRKYGYGKALTISERNNINLSVLMICSRDLVRRVKKYGRHSWNKHLTREESTICWECFLALWTGYYIGDGYSTRGYPQANSASIQLLQDFQQIWYDFGYVSYLYNLRKAGTCIILGKEYNQKVLYELAVVGYNNTRIRPLQSWIFDNKLYSKIQSIEEVEVPSTYDTYWMAVSGNKTFCIPNAIVHNTEKQNAPVDITKIMVTKDQLHWEDFTRSPIQAILKKAYNFGSLDPSLGKKSTSGDYYCICTLSRDHKTGYLYVKHIELKRKSVDYQIDAIIDSYKDHHYKLFCVETNAFQYVVAQNLRKKSREQSVLIPIKDIDNYIDKKMRIQGIVPLITDGTIVFDRDKYRRNNQYRTGVDQLLTFTGEGDLHDDFPDALEMAVRIARKSRFRTLSKQNR